MMPRGVYVHQKSAVPSAKVMLALPREVLAGLDEYARRKGVSRSSAVRGAINRMLIRETIKIGDVKVL